MVDSTALSLIDAYQGLRVGIGERVGARVRVFSEVVEDRWSALGKLSRGGSTFMHWKFAGQSPLIHDLLFVLFVMSCNSYEGGQLNTLRTVVP